MTPMTPHVLVFSTLGHGSNEEARIRELTAAFSPTLFPFDRSKKRRMFGKLLGEIRRTRPDVLVMEGTGLAGGLACLASRFLFGTKYVVSSGDAVGPWVGQIVRVLGPVFGLYERLLCRFAAGFIGWTPYLAGRALTFGTKRVMTAAGWAPFVRSSESRDQDRRRTREAYGIPQDAIVAGMIGSLAWNRRFRYCYGQELVSAARLVKRENVVFLIVGDGTGKAHLERQAAGLPAGRVIFTGRKPQEQLPEFYAAMDVASLPQSVDKVGSFRYTTKLPEYLAFGLPVVTGTIPLAYDLDGGWLWRLPGHAPWDPAYATAFAELLDRLTLDELESKRHAVPQSMELFDRQKQAARTTDFLHDLIATASRK